MGGGELMADTIFCICSTCHPPDGHFSKYNSETRQCEGLHDHAKPGFLEMEDGSETIYNCPSGCDPTPCVNGICMSCETAFEKVYAKDLKTNLRRPKNFMILYPKSVVKRAKEVGKIKDYELEEETPVCPQCGRLNEEAFLTEPERIEAMGFVPNRNPNFDQDDWAPYGLCVAQICIDEQGRHPFGVPLSMPRQDAVENVSIPQRQDDSTCSDCEQGTLFINTNGISECDLCGHQPSGHAFDITPGRGLGDALSAMRDEFMKALPLEKAGFVDPPYTYVANENPFTRSAKRSADAIVTAGNQPSEKKQGNEWFECLAPYLSTMRTCMQSTTAAQKIALASYIDKVFARRHIEPVWMYMRRSGVGNDLTTAFKNFNDSTACNDLFDALIQPNVDALSPSHDSLKCTLNIMKLTMGSIWPFHVTVGDEDNQAKFDDELHQTALRGLKALEQWPHYAFFSEKLLSEPYDLGGRIPHPPGLIELICVLWGIRQKNADIYQQVRGFLFPDKDASFWKMCLNEKGQRLVNNLDKIHATMSNISD